MKSSLILMKMYRAFYFVKRVIMLMRRITLLIQFGDVIEEIHQMELSVGMVLHTHSISKPGEANG